MQKGSNEQFLNIFHYPEQSTPTNMFMFLRRYSWARSFPWTTQSDWPGRSGVLGKACDWAHLLGGEWPEKSKIWWCTGEKSWEALTQKKNELMLLSINLLSFKMRMDKKIKWDWYEHSQSSPAVYPRNAWHWDSSAFHKVQNFNFIHQNSREGKEACADPCWVPFRAGDLAMLPRKYTQRGQSSPRSLNSGCRWAEIDKNKVWRRGEEKERERGGDGLAVPVNRKV